ncbi:glycosyl hydrolase [bacterium]|nr:glycosyl hydrolase [bacterium]
MKRVKHNSAFRVRLWVGTRKGLWTLTSDLARKKWTIAGPEFLGQTIYHAFPDPRRPNIVVAAAKTGHLGPTVFRSVDGGKTWKEAKAPPKFTPHPKTGERALEHVFWLTAGHASEPGVWYAGTAPHGIFRSEDNGDTWASVTGFNDNPMWPRWSHQGAGANPPDLPNTHSIRIDPRDPNHVYAAFSAGGVHESLDRGKSWRPLNQGVATVFPAEKDPEFFGNDPHCFVVHPANPDRLYQQNHCGIYRLDRPGEKWTRIGNNMPKSIGDIGFPIVVHPRDPDTAWVFPMDGTEVWPRTSPGGKPAVYGTRDAGESWKRLDSGFPRSQSFLTVKRQSMGADNADPVGVYLGTTSGDIWASRDEGARWQRIAQSLPSITSVVAFRA